MEAPARQRTHPVVLAAAASVVVFALAATASLVGWLPVSQGETKLERDPVSTPASNPGATPQAAPVARPEREPVAPKPASAARPPAKPSFVAPPRENAAVRVASAEPARAAAPEPARIVEPAPTAPPPPLCRDCGVVDSVRVVEAPGEGTGLGAVIGGVTGGAVGTQIGKGKGRTVATVLGALGGAVAGHQVEKHVRSAKTYEVTVRLDDGGYRTLQFGSPPAWQPGNRVRLAGDAIERID